MSTPGQGVIDANYRAKLAARANNSTPVLTQAPEPGDIRGDDQSAVDARYRAKVESRKRVASAPAPAEPEAKPDTAKVEGKPRGKSDADK